MEVSLTLDLSVLSVTPMDAESQKILSQRTAEERDEYRPYIVPLRRQTDRDRRRTELSDRSRWA